MKNKQIDEHLRRAFELGQKYRAEHSECLLSEASNTWGGFEEFIADVMMNENGDTNVVDEEAVRRRRYE